MSSDEFDPAIERLFARSPQMVDAAIFVGEVETRLQSSNRVRTLALTLAGAIGGVIAVRESMNLNLRFSDQGAPVAGRIIGEGIQAAGIDAQGAVAGALAQMGVADVTLGSMGGMQLFWLAAGALIAMAAAGVMRLSQEV